MSKDRIAIDGEAITGDTLSSRIEQRLSFLQSSYNYPNPVVVEGLFVYYIDSTSYCVTSGMAFMGGAKYILETATNEAISSIGDKVIYLKYTSAEDISPSFNCFEYGTMDIDDFDFPAHSVDQQAEYLPLAVRINGNYYDIRRYTAPYFIRQSYGVPMDLGVDDDGYVIPNSLFTVINDATEDSAIENTAVLFQNLSQYGYAVYSKGNLRLTGNIVMDSGMKVTDGTNTFLHLWTVGSEHRLGIDQENPQYTCHVNGDAYFTEVTVNSTITADSITATSGTFNTIAVSGNADITYISQSEFAIAGKFSAGKGGSFTSDATIFTDSIETDELEVTDLLCSNLNITGSFTYTYTRNVRTNVNVYEMFSVYTNEYSSGHDEPAFARYTPTTTNYLTDLWLEFRGNGTGVGGYGANHLMVSHITDFIVPTTITTIYIKGTVDSGFNATEDLLLVLQRKNNDTGIGQKVEHVVIEKLTHTFTATFNVPTGFYFNPDVEQLYLIFKFGLDGEFSGDVNITSTLLQPFVLRGVEIVGTQEVEL